MNARLMRDEIIIKTKFVKKYVSRCDSQPVLDRCFRVELQHEFILFRVEELLEKIHLGHPMERAHESNVFGMLLLENDAEIGSNRLIDRDSLLAFVAVGRDGHIADQRPRLLLMMCRRRQRRKEQRRQRLIFRLNVTLEKCSRREIVRQARGEMRDDRFASEIRLLTRQPKVLLQCA